jgi:hypothetical protein
VKIIRLNGAVLDENQHLGGSPRTVAQIRLSLRAL